MLCPNEGKKDFDDLDCRKCKWYFQCLKMWQDGNIWEKEKSMGDNYSNLDIDKQADELKRLEKEIDKFSDVNLQEQEVKNSINMIGDNSTWEMIEVIKDVKLRIRYRMIFIKLGGKIPEKEI